MPGVPDASRRQNLEISRIAQRVQILALRRSKISFDSGGPEKGRAKFCQILISAF
jgi:hypothetical protein